jgi:beta-lactamase class A
MIALTALWTAVIATCPAAGLRVTLDSLARSVDGRIGISALVVETGTMVSVHGNDRFPMQSVYKLPIAMAILDRVDRGALRLDQLVPVDSADIAPVHSPITERFPKGGITLSVRELLHGAIVESDGTASDVLLKLVSTGAVTGLVRRLGVGGMNIVASEKAMARDSMVQYRNWATPSGTIALLRVLQEGRGLTAASRELLLGWLVETGIGAARLKAGLPPSTVVAHKTGTDRTSGGLTRATNDVGIVTLPSGRHLAIAVFVADSRAEEAAREGVIAAVARAVWACHLED